jgi:hypothetical protein
MQTVERFIAAIHRQIVWQIIGDVERWLSRTSTVVEINALDNTGLRACEISGYLRVIPIIGHTVQQRSNSKRATVINSGVTRAGKPIEGHIAAPAGATGKERCSRRFWR